MIKNNTNSTDKAFDVPCGLALRCPVAPSQIRKLEIDDYYKGYFELLSLLAEAPDIGFEAFKNILERLNPDHRVFVIEKEGKIITNGAVIIQQKFVHGAIKAAYLENLVVHKDYQNQGLGKKMLAFLLDVAKQEDCYKSTLTCTDENINFYTPLGFEKRYNHMAIYHKK